MEPISFWDSRTECLQTEAVFGESALRWLYETGPGRLLSSGLLNKPWFSRFYGGFQDTAWSARKIERFIRDYRIDMGEYEPGPFRTFNEFFIRKFKPGRRPFAAASGELPAFAEARYFAFDRLDPEQRFPIKGIALTATDLLGGTTHAQPFIGGPAWIARLCPVDYHRYHYPDDGTTTSSYPLAGALHSVSPIALKTKPDILMTNERRVALLDTRSLGRLAYVEVGAMSVGKIVQSHAENTPFRRGEEKGHFLFGGSTVVLLAEPGRWQLDAATLERSRNGVETFFPLGACLGRRGHD